MVEPIIYDKQVGHYKIATEKLLGSGNYGSVVVGKDTRNDRDVAVKIQSIAHINQHEKYREFYDRELDILKNLNSEYIVQLYDAEETSNNCYFFTELCECSLDQHIDKLDTLDKKYSIIIDIIRGFQVLSEKAIIHRDIKPANILIKGGKAKIGDFGFAKILTGDPNQPRSGTGISTPIFCAPELLTNVSQKLYVDEVTAKCDVFSVGILIFKLMFNNFPWGKPPNNLELFKNTIKTKPLEIPNDPAIDEDLKILLRQMLQYDFNQRISWDEVFQSNFVKTRI